MSDRVRVVAQVGGLVQGVGYRAFVVRRAAAGGVSGSATNLADGRVEVIAEGPAADVRALVADLSGPDAPGRVAGVEQREEEPRGLAGFTAG
ncbi:acylphosphatase [Modestobacter sp. DSM 44400]|uniref:acylphosphatase n=1 Tax=Modestobacter sp. DSM 44400 TaxID=1550230 RepID=UPI00089ADC57|nr:acylphosphatase [Modestobacter sp. DSM 44400]SDX67891.1 acylphosphatase [Modestobacter sp. DSM 44400]